MPDWTSKDRRQYEHIKESAEDRGRSERRAKEIAARTVNKERREEGRAGNSSRSRQSGSAHKGSLDDFTKEELYDKARNLGIQGRSKMGKRELVEAIRKQQ